MNSEETDLLKPITATLGSHSQCGDAGCPAIRIGHGAPWVFGLFALLPSLVLGILLLLGDGGLPAAWVVFALAGCLWMVSMRRRLRMADWRIDSAGVVGFGLGEDGIVPWGRLDEAAIVGSEGSLPGIGFRLGPRTVVVSSFLLGIPPRELPDTLRTIAPGIRNRPSSILLRGFAMQFLVTGLFLAAALASHFVLVPVYCDVLKRAGGTMDANGRIALLGLMAVHAFGMVLLPLGRGWLMGSWVVLVGGALAGAKSPLGLAGEVRELAGMAVGPAVGFCCVWFLLAVVGFLVERSGGGRE